MSPGTSSRHGLMARWGGPRGSWWFWTERVGTPAPLNRVVATEERGWSASLLDGDPKSPGLVDLKRQVFRRRPQGDFHDPSWVGRPRDLGGSSEVA